MSQAAGCWLTAVSGAEAHDVGQGCPAKIPLKRIFFNGIASSPSASYPGCLPALAPPDPSDRGRASWSDVSEYAVKRPGNPGEIKRAHEQARVPALPAGSGPHEPVQLPVRALLTLGGLLLEDAE